MKHKFTEISKGLQIEEKPPKTLSGTGMSRTNGENSNGERKSQ